MDSSSFLNKGGTPGECIRKRSLRGKKEKKVVLASAEGRKKTNSELMREEGRGLGLKRMSPSEGRGI